MNISYYNGAEQSISGQGSGSHQPSTSSSSSTYYSRFQERIASSSFIPLLLHPSYCLAHYTNQIYLSIKRSYRSFHSIRDSSTSLFYHFFWKVFWVIATRSGRSLYHHPSNYLISILYLRRNCSSEIEGIPTANTTVLLTLFT